MMARLFSSFALFFLVDILPFVGTPSLQAQIKHLALGYPSPSSNQISYWVAKEEGFYKKFGLDAELILIVGGPRGAQALIAGDVSLMAMEGQPVISARAQGSDLVLVGGMVNRLNYILASTPGIKSPKDLKGKRIGISQIGSASYYGVLLALKHWGLDANRDGIIILQLGTQSARVSSMQSGGNDATIVNPGLSSIMKERGFNVLADFTQLPIPYPNQTIAAREHLVRSDPDLIERALKALITSNAYILNPRNKERVKATLAKYLKLDKLDQAEDHYHSAIKVLPRKPYVDPDGISSMIRFLAETDPKVAKVKPSEVIDHTILKKLDESGWIDQL